GSVPAAKPPASPRSPLLCDLVLPAPVQFSNVRERASEHSPQAPAPGTYAGIVRTARGLCRPAVSQALPGNALPDHQERGTRPPATAGRALASAPGVL